MPGTQSCRRSHRLFALVAVVALVAMHASSAISPAHAQGLEENRDTATADTSWPTFTDALDEPVIALAVMPPWTRQGIERSSTTISAPLPQAAATGLFMLAGNWIVTRLWKKRKI